MEIYVSSKQDNLKVDFICEAVVPASQLLLLITTTNTNRWIIKLDSPSPDIKTDPIAEFQLRPIKHFVYGHFMHKGQKVSGQLAAYTKRVGVAGFDYVFIPNDFISGGYKTPNAFFKDVSYQIIDLQDFNETRKLLGLDEYNIVEYIAAREGNPIADEYGLTLEDHTTLFSITPDTFDKSNLMTVNGLKIFLEQQDYKYSG